MFPKTRFPASSSLAVACLAAALLFPGCKGDDDHQPLSQGLLPGANTTVSSGNSSSAATSSSSSSSAGSSSSSSSSSAGTVDKAAQTNVLAQTDAWLGAVVQLSA